MLFPEFVGGSYPSRSRNVNCERTVNWIVERVRSAGAKSRSWLRPTPGILERLAVTEGPIRGLYPVPDPIGSVSPRMFAVAGFKLYEVMEDDTAIDRGDVEQDTNPATFASNGVAGHQVFITSGGIGYIYDLISNVLTADVVETVTMSGLMDGYFLGLDAETATLKISDLVDGLTWNPLQIAQRTAGADQWVAMGVTRKQIWLFGRLTTEVWYDAGNFPFPFAPIPDAFFEQGIDAPFSISKIGDDSLMWLGQNAQGKGIVYRAQGLQPEEVSDEAIESAIQGYGTTSDAIAFTFQLNGHTIYVLNFPTENKTWLFDTQSSTWTEWLFWNTTTAQYEAARAINHAFVFGRHYVGDRSTGTIYELSSDIYTDAGGAAIRRLRRTPHLTSEQYVSFFHKFTLDMDVGVGLANGQGSDPRIMLRTSDDGGNTWTGERPASVGPTGTYGTPVFWRQLGSGKDRVFEVSTSDPVPYQIAQAYLEVTKGSH